MRSLPLILLLLASCGEGDDGAAATAAGAEKVECAVAGATRLERVCTVERSTATEVLTLTIRGPNGSFRRLLVTKDGRGVVAADGAAPAVVAPAGPDRIDVSIDGDRYRLPATVEGQ